MAHQREAWSFLIGLVVLQTAIWAWLYWRHGPLRAPMHRWLERPGNEGKRENVKLNGQLDSGWSFWTVIVLHHSLGGLIALAGSLAPSRELSVFLVRIGLSFEIGEDILHFIQLARSMFCIPGSEMFSEIFIERGHWIAMICHHMIGLIGGSFVFVYIPEWPEAQFIIVLLLLAAVPSLIHIPFMPFVNLRSERLTSLGKLLAGVMLVGTCASLFARIFIFSPVAWSLLQKAQQIYGTNLAIALACCAVLFVLFSLLSILGERENFKKIGRHFCGSGVGEEQPETLVSIAITAASSSFLVRSQQSQMLKTERLELS